MPESNIIRNALLRLSVFVSFVGLSGVLLFPSLKASFENNIWLNAFIVSLFCLGVVLSFLSLLRLGKEHRWLRQASSGLSSKQQRRLHFLAPVASLFDKKGENTSLRLTTHEVQGVTQAIESRLYASHEVPRYLIGLLIFLGLLGTFWGLTQTIRAVSGVISNLSVQGDSLLSFEALQESLRGPLGGMGTAFSCSMFGLAGSLILGFIEMQVERTYRKFYYQVEEWLNSMTRTELSAVNRLHEAAADPEYILKVLEFVAEGVDKLQRSLSKGEENTRALVSSIYTLAEKTTLLIESTKASQTLLTKLTEMQSSFSNFLQQTGGELKIDEDTRSHFRMIEAHLARLTEESLASRQQIAEDLRKEIRLVARQSSDTKDDTTNSTPSKLTSSTEKPALRTPIKVI